MDLVKKDNKEVAAESHRIRITLSSRNAKAIEKVMTDLLNRSKEKEVKVRGPMRLPTKTLKITTRKTPCGNGTNTWDVYEMKIFKRVIDLLAPQDVAQTITSINVEAGVDVQVKIM
mmetsp:Transcript_12327/g.23397  ORF Transcript_12327/g.23397 Transcript_12327/m.23397 type:complete len:116 (+) Transcript_12327:25-372(+)|eukprot:CAMPEP_0204898416 /NCGR_PEP_ID=MMETSP1397-20131031/1283_1 /ASSEMBLY_ACC=CAM_ASM_000891 /TAXON_ID=49980 /ORGANISM="Climacostomum Climacostomum virens, Strain Stock W-24" /LENGTH=115 /DNA_ID=CAMNT_0052066265 /DNA_START=12 /DNA_END=359 /DNA_ORIENTATION=+